MVYRARRPGTSVFAALAVAGLGLVALAESVGGTGLAGFCAAAYACAIVAAALLRPRLKPRAESDHTLGSTSGSLKDRHAKVEAESGEREADGGRA